MRRGGSSINLKGLRMKPQNGRLRHRLGAAMLSFGLVVGAIVGVQVATVQSASAHHPVGSGSYKCDPSTGKFDLEYTFSSDSDYNKDWFLTAVSTSPSNLSLTWNRPTGTSTDDQNDFVATVQDVPAGTYTVNVTAKWHRKGNVSRDVATQTGSVTVKPKGTCTQDTKQIEAKALCDHQIDNTEWHFVITQVRDKASAPAFITVVWDNGQTADVPLDKFTGGVAHYATTSNLSANVLSATVASIYGGWSGQFNLSHGPACVKRDASASVSITPATCDSAEKLVLGTISNATWGTPTRTTGPGNYSVTATGNAGPPQHLFSDGSPSRTFTGILGDKLDPSTTPDCRPTKPEPKREERPKTGSPDCAALTYQEWKEERFSKVEWDSSTKAWKHVWSDNWTEVQGSRVTKDVTDPQLCDMGLELTGTASCGTATLTLHNRSPWIYPVSYREVMQGDAVPVIGSPDAAGPYGPVVDNRGSAPNDQTKSKTFTYPEDSGTHVIYYAVRAGTEDQLWKGKPAGELKSIVVKTDCEPNKVPLPADQASTDSCNPPGVTNNVEWAALLSASTEDVIWTEDGATRTATLVQGRNLVWEDGTDAPKVFHKKADSGEMCPVAMPAASGIVDCSGFVVSLDNARGTDVATFVVVTPTKTIETIMVPAGQKTSRTYPVIEDQTASVTVKSEGMENFTLSYAADCAKTPPPKTIKVKGGVKKLDKCDYNNFAKFKKVEGLYYVVQGETMREGKWIKFPKKRVVVKVMADSPKYKVVGKKRFVLKFPNNKSCSPPPVKSPHTGLPRLML